MIENFLWLLPIVCLSGSILCCSIRLWLMYKEKVYIRAHQILKKIGLWKTGVGRWIRLRRYGRYYIFSAILSVFISVAISLVTEAGVIEQITTFVERLSVVELSKFLATAGFATITALESVLMYGCDFSKADRQKFLFKWLLYGILPVAIWIPAGVSVYKDYFFRAAGEWISSPGRVLQLCWGAVSVGIFGFALLNVIRDIRET